MIVSSWTLRNHCYKQSTLVIFFYQWATDISYQTTVMWIAVNIVTFWSPIFGNALTNFLLSYKHGQWTIGLVIGHLNNHYLSSSCSTRAFLTAIQPSLSPSCCSTLLKPVEARIKMSITGFARRRNESPAASCFDISCTEVGINQGSAGVL